MLNYLQVSAAACAGLLSLIMIALRLRVGWLRDMGRAPRQPRTPGPYFLGATWALVLSGEHRQIGDRATSFLVIASRALGLSLALFTVSLFALLSAEESAPSHAPPPRSSLVTPGRSGPHEEDDAFERNAWTLAALASGDFQSIVAHTQADVRTPQELDSLRTAAKLIPREEWTSSSMLENRRTFPGGIVVVYMSVKYDYPSSKSVILDTTFRYSSAVPVLVQMNLRPAD